MIWDFKAVSFLLHQVYRLPLYNDVTGDLPHHWTQLERMPWTARADQDSISPRIRPVDNEVFGFGVGVPASFNMIHSDVVIAKIFLRHVRDDFHLFLFWNFSFSPIMISNLQACAIPIRGRIEANVFFKVEKGWKLSHRVLLDILKIKINNSLFLSSCNLRDFRI